MKNTRIYQAALASVLLLSATTALHAAAGNMRPVKITLPYAVTVAGMPLAPGAYTIEELEFGSPVLIFRSENGTAVDVLANVIATPNNSVSNNTALVLHQSGAQREVQKLWIEGESWGFEIVMPAAHK
jgi:hypothetical protein